MSYQFLLYAVDDRVATITLNRPERHNALSQSLVDEIMAAVAQADADPEVRVLVVTGAGGKAFSAGYDIKEWAAAPKRTLVEWRVYGAEASAIMDSTGSPEADRFDAIRRSDGLAAALKWRTEQFAPYE